MHHGHFGGDGEGGGEGGVRARTRDADEKERSGRSFTDKGDNQQSNSTEEDGVLES